MAELWCGRHFRKSFSEAVLCMRIIHRYLLGKDAGDELSGRGLSEVNKLGLFEEPDRGPAKLEWLRQEHKENVRRIKRQP